MNTKSFFHKILIATLLCFALSFGFAKLAGLKNYPYDLARIYGNAGNLTHLEVKKSIPPLNLKRLVIRTVDTDVQITSTTNPNIEISFSGKVPLSLSGDFLTVENDGKQLTIKAAEEDIGFKGGIQMDFSEGEKNKILVITLPKDLALSIATVSGEINIKLPQVSDLQSKTVSGKTRVEARLKHVDAKSVSGHLTFTLPNGDPEMSLKSTSGDISLDLNKPNLELKFKSVSGQLRGAQKQSYGKGLGKIEVATVSGNLEFRTTN